MPIHNVSRSRASIIIRIMRHQSLNYEYLQNSDKVQKLENTGDGLWYIMDFDMVLMIGMRN